MSATRASRNRAVRLKPEAIETVNQALVGAWLASAAPGKLTREARAELLGISVVTTERLLSGSGVDRTTIRHAFARLGLPWNDELLVCESGLAVSNEISHPAQLQIVELASTQKEVRNRWGVVVPATLVVVLLFVGAASFAFHRTGRQGTGAKPHAPAQDWHEEFYAVLRGGSELYQEGRYDQARVKVDRAVLIARAQDSAAELSSAVRMSGDLDMLQGALPQAKASYEQALSLRNAMLQDVCKPPLLEALGDVETKLGEFREAHTALLSACSGFKDFNDRVGVAMASRDLGSLAYESHDQSAARSWFALALASVKGLSKPDLEVDILGRQALLLREEGHLTESRKQLEKCLTYWRGRGHPRWVAESELQLGTVEAEAHHPQTALALIGQSRAGFATVGDKWGEAQSQKWLLRLASPYASHS